MAFRVLALFGFLTGILLAIGFLLGGVVGMSIALILAIVINFSSYWFSSGIIIKMYHAKPTENKELHEIVKKIDEMEKTEVKSIQYTQYAELFGPWTKAALFILVLEMLASCTIFRKIP